MDSDKELSIEELKEACKELCDDINNRYPDKDPHAWKCPYMRKIAELINYQRETMSKEHCCGCESNPYNNGLGGAKQCWCLESARLIMRKEVHVDQSPPWNQKPKLLPSCYRRKRYVYVKPDQTC